MDGLVPLTGEADAKHTDDDAATMRLRYRRYSFLALLTRREEVVQWWRGPRAQGQGAQGPAELAAGHTADPGGPERAGRRGRTTSRPYPF